MSFAQQGPIKQLTLSVGGVLELTQQAISSVPRAIEEEAHLHLRQAEPNVVGDLADLGPRDGVRLDRLDRELIVRHKRLEHRRLRPT